MNHSKIVVMRQFAVALKIWMKNAKIVNAVVVVVANIMKMIMIKIKNFFVIAIKLKENLFGVINL